MLYGTTLSPLKEAQFKKTRLRNVHLTLFSSTEEQEVLVLKCAHTTAMRKRHSTVPVWTEELSHQDKSLLFKVIPSSGTLYIHKCTEPITSKTSKLLVRNTTLTLQVKYMAGHDPPHR